MSNLTSQKKWFDSAIRRLLLNPVNIALAILLMVLAYLVLWPFFQLVIETLTWGEGDRRLSRDAVPGEFTWFHWLQATASPISEKMLYSPLLNTLITGVISTVLAQKYDVLATEGNLNNHIGVPLTLLAARNEPDVAIIEMIAAAGIILIGTGITVRRKGSQYWCQCSGWCQCASDIFVTKQ